jgi:hypothetical protein
MSDPLSQLLNGLDLDLQGPNSPRAQELINLVTSTMEELTGNTDVEQFNV